MPEVSIIVPNYNHAPYLRERLDSIFNQTFQDIEVILLDDCSTDNSRSLLGEYARHPKVSHAVYNEVNTKSPSKQWIKGLSLAKGEWIWIAESDDFAETTFLETLVRLIKESPLDIGFAVCNSFLTDKEGKVYSSTDTMNDMSTFCQDKDYHIFPKDQFYEKYLGAVNHLYNASSMVFKKAKVDRPESIQDFVISGDWMLWSTILAKSQAVLYVDQKLNYFRRVPGSVTYSNQTVARLESIQILFAHHVLGLQKSAWKAASMAANWVSKLHPYQNTHSEWKDLNLVSKARLTMVQKILLFVQSILLQIKLRLK